jgi:hypothetical protein
VSQTVRRRPLSAGDVIIDFDGQQVVASNGDTVTIGRSRTCHIHLPDDAHLSRRAGALRILDDCVMVHNESQRKPLVIRPPTGEDRVVEPGAATTSLPFQRFDLLLVGSGGLVVSIHIDAARLTPDTCVNDPLTSTPETKSEPIMLSGTQRKVLLALCAPLLTPSGPMAVPATYAQIGQRLGLQPQYIRNVMKSLRETLSGHGVPGLIRDEHNASHDDFRLALARWAIRGGWVKAEDADGGDDRG